MRRLLTHAAIAALLTALTQLGGLAWLAALGFRRRWLAFPLFYAALTLAAIWTAPLFGRTALSCWERGPLQVQSWMYCAMNRNYVTPELARVLADAAERLNAEFPGTKTLVLDANFPFLDGFPLPPHLSHDDGEKADLAFFYQDGDGYMPGGSRSPIGYFAFEDGPTGCPREWLTLRWNLRPLQPLWPEHALEPRRTRRLTQLLAEDARVGKILLEPHLKQMLGVNHGKVRFQGCRAARHDDHIHMQLL